VPGAERTSPGHSARAGGFTLIEAAVAIVIVGLAVVAMMGAQQAYHQQGSGTQQMSTAMMLANEIRELALEMPLRDPIYGTWKYGPEPDEADDDPHTAVQAFDDLDDFAGTSSDGVHYTGTTFEGPIDALRQPIPNMDGWSQWVTVENVAVDNMAGSAQAAHATDMVRLTAQVRYRSDTNDTPREVARLTWVSAGQP
jgi:type II secretory pathway pseudopilin PulG